ncbi:MAG: 16S rRNA (guanine(527)-N(7))-methyltransferase RsmG [Chitinophagales bacterium]
MEKTQVKLELIKAHFGPLDAKQSAQFSALDELYREWNSRINIISRKDIDQLYENHVLHSLSIAAFYQFETNDQIIDIGTGGGFPGIPLAIFFPEAHFHLIDSIGKKIKVVDAIAHSIGLENISTAHTRAEEIKGRQFDCAVSRAVAPLQDLWKWARPLIRKRLSGRSILVPDHETAYAKTQKIVPNGLICLKGGDLAEEIALSSTIPTVIDIFHYFNRPFFKEKYIIYVPLKRSY